MLSDASDIGYDAREPHKFGWSPVESLSIVEVGFKAHTPH
jgi:hypothetical protein